MVALAVTRMWAPMPLALQSVKKRLEARRDKVISCLQSSLIIALHACQWSLLGSRSISSVLSPTCFVLCCVRVVFFNRRGFGGGNLRTATTKCANAKEHAEQNQTEKLLHRCHPFSLKCQNGCTRELCRPGLMGNGTTRTADYSLRAPKSPKRSRDPSWWGAQSATAQKTQLRNIHGTSHNFNMLRTHPAIPILALVLTKTPRPEVQLLNSRFRRLLL